MHVLKDDAARYAPEAKLIVLPARGTAGVQATSFDHVARLTIHARLAARTTLARHRVGGHLRLPR